MVAREWMVVHRKHHAHTKTAQTSTICHSPVRKHRPMFATEQTISPSNHTLNTCHGRRGGSGRR